MPKLLSNPYTKAATATLQPSSNYITATGNEVTLKSRGDIVLTGGDVRLDAGRSLNLGNGHTSFIDQNGVFRVVVDGKEMFNVDGGIFTVDNISVKGSGSIAGRTEWNPTYTGGNNIDSISEVVGYNLDGIVTLSMLVVPSDQWVDCVIQSSLPSDHLELSSCTIRDNVDATILNQSITIDGNQCTITFLSQSKDTPHRLDLTFVPK